MISVVALTISLVFFATVARAEARAGDSEILRPILAIIGLLVIAIGLESHEIIVASQVFAERRTGIAGEQPSVLRTARND
jgi:hypothetical protein